MLTVTPLPSRWAWFSLTSRGQTAPYQAQVDASTSTDEEEIMRQPSAAPNVDDAHIHQRPLARYDSVGLGGVHAWAFVKATAPGASLSAAIPLVLSILLMCGQSAIMYAVAYEAAHPRCSSHNHCAVGEYCHPKDFYIFGEQITRQPWRHEKAPGVCLDCYNMQLTAENISGIIMALDSRRHVLGPYVDIYSNSRCGPER